MLGAAPESGHEPPHTGAAPHGADLSVRLQVADGTCSLFTSIFGTLPQVVLVPKLFEVIFDEPLLGLWLDSLRSPWGRRRPLMAASVVGIALSMPWLFNPVVYEDSSATALQVGLIFFACTLAYSLFFVPYLSLPTEMTDRPNVRTRLMAWRIGFLLAGVLTAGAGAPWIVKWAGSGLHGYAVMGWIFTAICVVAMVIALAGKAEARLASPSTRTSSSCGWSGRIGRSCCWPLPMACRCAGRRRLPLHCLTSSRTCCSGRRRRPAFSSFVSPPRR